MSLKKKEQNKFSHIPRGSRNYLCKLPLLVFCFLLHNLALFSWYFLRVLHCAYDVHNPNSNLCLDPLIGWVEGKNPPCGHHNKVEVATTSLLPTPRPPLLWRVRGHTLSILFFYFCVFYYRNKIICQKLVTFIHTWHGGSTLDMANWLLTIHFWDWISMAWSIW